MYITRAFIKHHPFTLFLFGDNDLREGLGGMAKEFRGEHNTIGIRTKKAPGMHLTAFYLEKENIDNCKRILEDFVEVHKLMQGDLFYSTCIPKGIGKGLSHLEENAPSTFEFLENHKAMCRKDYKDRLLVTD